MFKVFARVTATVALMAAAIFGIGYLTDLINVSNNFAVFGGVIGLTLMVGVLVGTMKALWWPKVTAERPGRTVDE